jgi:hypothetical protein
VLTISRSCTHTVPAHVLGLYQIDLGPGVTQEVTALSGLSLTEKPSSRPGPQSVPSRSHFHNLLLYDLS